MAAATMYVTAAGAGAKNGTDWDNAFGYAEWETDLEGSAEAGDIYYVKEGTYTLTSDFTTALDGTTVAPIKIIGVKTETTATPPTFSDWAFGTDRPVIAAGAYVVNIDDYWHLYNLRITSTDVVSTYLGTGSMWINCDCNNSSESAGRTAFSATSSTALIGCEAQSANGIAVALSSYCKAVACYIHDSATGVNVVSYATVVLNCVIDTCTTGISLGANQHGIYANNTLYSGTTGISGTTASPHIFLNNIIDAFTTGASWTTAEPINYWDFNCWDNTSDTSNVTKGNSAVTADPGLNNPAAGDFSIDSGDNVYDVALDAGDWTGATV